MIISRAIFTAATSGMFSGPWDDLQHCTGNAAERMLQDKGMRITAFISSAISSVRLFHSYASVGLLISSGERKLTTEAV